MCGAEEGGAGKVAREMPSHCKARNRRPFHQMLLETLLKCFPIGCHTVMLVERLLPHVFMKVHRMAGHMSASPLCIGSLRRYLWNTMFFVGICLITSWGARNDGWEWRFFLDDECDRTSQTPVERCGRLFLQPQWRCHDLSKMGLG